MGWGRREEGKEGRKKRMRIKGRRKENENKQK